MADRREPVHSLINAVRSAGLPLTAWTIERGEIHLMMTGGVDVVMPVAGIDSSTTSIVADLARRMAGMVSSLTVRSPDEIIELSPGQAAHLRFIRWLVATGRLSGDTGGELPTAVAAPADPASASP
jgi:hypothetical protein